MIEDRMITLTIEIPARPVLEVLRSVQQGELLDRVHVAISDMHLRGDHAGKYINACETAGLISFQNSRWFLTVLGKTLADELDVTAGGWES